MNVSKETARHILYLLYDGECILCRNSAQAIKIKKSIGEIELINAREAHPLVKEVFEAGYDLNEGIVVKYSDQYFYGADAVHFLALMGSHSDLFNKINAFLFKHKWMSHLFYPFFKTIRNIILFIRKTPRFSRADQSSLSQKIYNDSNIVPKVLQQRYANRPYSNDILLLQGEVNITVSNVFRFLSPLLRLAGAPAPYAAKKIAATVELVSSENLETILMKRTFYYLHKPPYHFNSKIIHLKDNIVIELMRFGLAARLIYSIDNNKIAMHYGGYGFYLGNRWVRLPLGFLIGKFSAYEEAVSDDQFNMLVNSTHPLLGNMFQYDGYFKIVGFNE